MPRTGHGTEDDVVRLRQAGFTIREIAEDLQCCVRSVERTLQSRGISAGRRDRVEVTRQQMLELWATPKTLVEIGAELGCSSTTVLRLQKAHDLPRRECVRPDPDEEVTPEEDAASADSLALSPWVQARIKELRLGLPQEVTA